MTGIGTALYIGLPASLRRRFLAIALPVLLSAAVPQGAWAVSQGSDYSRRRIQAVRAPSPPTIDGDLSDPVWAAAPVANTFIDRDRTEPAPDQTVAHVLYDDNAIYVSFYCYDSQPNEIVARETVRDSKYERHDDSEDNVEFVLDPFRTYRWSDRARFSVNPLGTPSARISGGRANKAEWRGDWSGAARRVRDGWTAEMAIPWAILNYPRSRGPVTMGINFMRWQERTRIRSRWSDEGPTGREELEGLWVDVQPPADGFRPRVSVLPYTLGGFRRGDLIGRAGLDMRYPATTELTVVATVNPDFGTIEGAVQGIQFSRSERFVPEKRPFFLEGRDYIGAGNEYTFGPFFYPNRIGMFDVGAKVYGKITPRDTIGMLGTADFGNRSDFVLNVRHDLDATATMGVFLSQLSSRDDNNTVALVSQRWERGKLSLSHQWATASGLETAGTAQQIGLSWEDRNLFSSLQLLRVSPRFRVADGLIWFTDFKGVHLYNTHGGQWRHGPLRAFHLELGGLMDWYTDGRPFRAGANLGFGVETRSDWGLSLGFDYQRFDGQMDRTMNVGLICGASNRFRQWGIRLTTGVAGDRPYTFLGPGFSVRVLGKTDIVYSGALVTLDGSTQQHIVTLGYELTPTRSFGGRLVVSDGTMNWYVSYRQSGEKGTETFVMFGDPNAERFVETLQVKFVFAL